MCSNFKFPLIGPPALRVNIIKNIINSSIVVQWDAVDDFLPTTYTVTWTDGRDLHGGDTVIEQTSYTITGLTLDTVYTITISACNRYCVCGPEFRTSVSLSTDTTFTTSTISPTVTVSTNPMTITSTVNPVSIIVSAITTTITTTTTTITVSAITTTNSMTVAVSRDTSNTIKFTTSRSSNSNMITITVTTCFGMYIITTIVLLSPIIIVYIRT